jgi:septation ring formation regulator EzrA
MEKKITEDELSNIRRIMRDFSFVHHQINEISSEINNLNKKSENLVDNLEKIRKEESEFLGILSEKYGSGILDPFKMVYITQESNE